MANWANYRLVVHGRRPSVIAFSRRYPARRSSGVWGRFFVGETSDLRGERIVVTARGIARKAYAFQAAREDPAGHFRRLSRIERGLVFVLVEADPNSDNYGSALIRNGSVRRYRVPESVEAAVMDRHGVTGSGDDEEDWRFWEASWELTDLAEAHWARVVEKALA